MTPQPGADLPQLEGCEILAKLGGGGMGTVYKARQPDYLLTAIQNMKILLKHSPDVSPEPLPVAKSNNRSGHTLSGVEMRPKRGCQEA